MVGTEKVSLQWKLVTREQANVQVGQLGVEFRTSQA